LATFLLFFKEWMGTRVMFGKVFTTNILIVIVVGLATLLTIEAVVYYKVDANGLSAQVP
jgi:hypothetical protein